MEAVIVSELSEQVGPPGDPGRERAPLVAAKPDESDPGTVRAKFQDLSLSCTRLEREVRASGLPEGPIVERSPASLCQPPTVRAGQYLRVVDYQWGFSRVLLEACPARTPKHMQLRPFCATISWICLEPLDFT